jgi:hypothetical protein
MPMGPDPGVIPALYVVMICADALPHNAQSNARPRNVRRREDIASPLLQRVSCRLAVGSKDFFEEFHLALANLHAH